MQVSDFDYHLPERLIAQEPVAQRDRSRMLVVDRSSHGLTDTIFNHLPEYLSTGDVLVLNNTRVFPARLIGRRLRQVPSGTVLGGRVEVFLLRRIEPLIWETLVCPGRLMMPGARIEFARGKLTAKVVEWRDSGRRIVSFEAKGDFNELIDRVGRTPLPPYIKRDEEDRLDAERYQTVFARERGAVAAPTAGLHFTTELLGIIKSRGVDLVEISLHVGYGTFQPVRVERVEDHHVEPEAFHIDEASAHSINRALAEGRRVIAVGTTTTRALESAARHTESGAGGEVIRATESPVFTDLFIYPGFEFRVISGLVTNFHLPKSSLLMLVSAFGGREQVLDAYAHAVENEYRFYSYGDAMFIV